MIESRGSIGRSVFGVMALLSLLAVACVGCGNNDAPTSAPNAEPPAAKQAAYTVESFCPQICERTRALGCRAADRCDSMCRNAFSDMVCPDTLRPAMDCALSQPIAEWMCSEDGIGAVKDGPCDALQLAYDKCLTAIK